MITLPNAYSFGSDLSLAAMLAALKRAGRLSWEERDSDFHGSDYLSTRLDDGTRLRIFPDKGTYVLDIGYIRTRAGTKSREEIETIVQRDVLPIVGAREVTPREAWD